MDIALIIIGIIVGIAILISPFFGLIAIVALIPQSIIQAVSGTILGVFSVGTPIKIVGGLTFVSSFVRYVSKGKKWDVFKKPTTRFYILFLIWILISGFTQPGSFTRENFTAFTSFAMLGFIILSMVSNLKRFRIIIWTSLISIVIVSLISIFNYLISQTGIRIAGMTYGPNEFAIGLIPIIGVSFYNISYEKKIMLKLLSLFISVIVVVALILTFSRGGLIGLAGMLLLGSLKAKKKIKAFLLLAFISLMIINFMPAQVWERFEKTTIKDKIAGEGTIDSTTRRFYLAKAAWDIFLVNPLFGIGIGNYYYECRLYEPVSAGRAHNMYLEIMAELGIVGIALFLGILFSTFKTLNRIRKSRLPASNYAWGLYIGLIGFLIAAIFLHAQQEKALWFVIFMVLALENIVKTERAKEK